MSDELKYGDVFVFLNRDGSDTDNGDPLMICEPTSEGYHRVHWVREDWSGVLPDHHILHMVSQGSARKLSESEALLIKLKKGNHG